MKKLFIAVLLVCIGLLLADPIPIGDGTETNIHIPMEPFYGYTYSQTIYLAEEIGTAADIENIAWHYNGSHAWTEDECVIYMGHTSMTDFGDTYPNWIPVDELTEVYSGPLSVLAFDHWVTVNLTNNFAYNGVDNLVIAFDANTEGCFSYSDEFFGTATTLNRSIYFYSDTNNPDPQEPPTGTSRENYDPQEAAKIGKTRERAGGVQSYIANIILNHDGILPSGFVNGYVYDQDTNAAIEGATITIGSFIGMSDANGFYEIESMLEGDLAVSATHPDYFPADAGNVTVVFDQTVSLDIYMEYNDLMGDQPGTAIAIDAFPFFDTGDTSLGYTSFIGNASPDVFYTFTNTETLLLDLHTCGSEFDTYLRLYDDSMTQVDYDDDGCSSWPTGYSSASWIGDGEGTLVAPGTYYVCVEGYSSNSGYYEFTAEELLPPEYGVLDGLVTDSLTGNPIEGVEVEIFGLTGYTDATGYYTISDIETGTYSADYSVDTYFPTTVDEIEILAEQTTTIDVTLDPIMYGSIDGTITEEGTGMPIEGAEVSFADFTANTDASGYFLINDIETGIYNLIVTADGYFPGNAADIEIMANQTTTVDLALEVFNDIGDTWDNPVIVDAFPYFMSGDIAPYSDYTTVMDLEYGRTGKDIFYLVDLPDGATAEFHGCGSEFDSYMNLYDDNMTRIAYDDDGCSDWETGSSMAPWIGQDDGSYSVVLTPGTYYVVFEGYSSSTTEGYFEVHLDLLAAPESGTIAGLVTDQYSGDPIAGAVVNCDSYQAVSDETGGYVIENIIPGDYQVTCEADGYETAPAVEVTIISNETTTVDFALAIMMVPPANLTAEVIGNSVELQWTAPDMTALRDSRENAQREFTGSYNVYRNNELIATVDQTSYLDEQVDAATYEYYVTSVYDEGESIASNVVTVTVVESYIYGDLTDDGVVDAFDAANVLQFTVGLDPMGAPLPWTWELIAGDVDGNGSPEAYDAALILQYAVGIITQFPVETRIAAPYANVDVDVQNGEFVFTATGSLLGFAVSTATDLISFNKPEIGFLHAINGNNVALANHQSINGEFLRIPYEILAENGDFVMNLSINGNSKEISFNLQDLETAPTANAVLGNFPNPFNPSTMIKFQVKEEAPVTVNIYNLKGQLVKTLINESLNSGTHALQWNGLDNSNNPVSSGVFFYSVRIADFYQTNKMIMLK